MVDEILKERLITNAEASEILKERSKEKELGYEQKNALEHLKKFNTITDKKAKGLLEDLKGVQKLTERQIMSIINLLPKDRDDLRVILEKDYKNITDEEKNQILTTVKKLE